METTKKRKKYVWWTDTEWNEVKELWSDWTSDNNPSTPKFREYLLSSFGGKYDDAGCPSERAMRRKLMGDFTGENVVNKKNKSTVAKQVSSVNDMATVKLPFPKRPTKLLASCGHETDSRLHEFCSKFYHGDKEIDMCFTCHTAKLSNEEQSLRDDEVLATLRNRHKSINVTWPDEGTKTILPNGIETDSVVTIMGEDIMKYCPDLPSSFLKCRKTIAFFEKKQRYKVLVLHPPQYTPAQENKLKGGNHPPKESYEHRNEQLLQCPVDSAMGLVCWSTKRGIDYATIGKLDITAETGVEISKKDTKSMLEMPLSKRAGPAGGVFVPSADRDFDPTYCSQATKENREFIRLGSGTSSSLLYLNPNAGRLIKYCSVYKNLVMKRMTKGEKRRELRNDTCQREKTIAEMTSRLMTMIVVSDLQLTDDLKKLWRSFKMAVDMVCRGNKNGWKYWRNDNGPLSIWETVLLEWASSTGEMRNYQPIAAHTDTNKSHPLESYTLFGKVPSNDVRSSNDIVGALTPGILSLPLLGIAFLVRCNLDVLHLQLRDTIHLSDDSRGRDNWSWVHGP